MMHPGKISVAKALVHAYLSGTNSFEIDRIGFMTGCSKFGLDSPVPCVTKRLAFYGNNEDIVKQVEQAFSLNPTSQIDPSLFMTAN